MRDRAGVTGAAKPQAEAKGDGCRGTMLAAPVAACLCIGWVVQPASAGDTDPATLPGVDAKGGWIVTVGVMPQYGPDFAGASSSSVSFVPQFGIRRDGEAAGLAIRN